MWPSRVSLDGQQKGWLVLVTRCSNHFKEVSLGMHRIEFARERTVERKGSVRLSYRGMSRICDLSA